LQAEKVWNNRLWAEGARRCMCGKEIRTLPREPAKKRRTCGSDACIGMAGNASVLLMDYDKDKVDEMVLALLYLTLHDEYRAWKGHDWEAMNRLHEKGMIENPVGKAKSVALTEEGLRRSRELFMEHFTRGARNTT
jgi:hypothetical protein